MWFWFNVVLWLVVVCADRVALDADAKQVLYSAESAGQFVEDFLRSDDRIIVSISALLDPELYPTIENMLDQAAYPDKLDFAILIQEDPDDPMYFPWENQTNFNVRRMNYLDSRGVGWARYTAKQLYGGQKYLLQLDSHHRFLPGWDRNLIREFGECIKHGHIKPILSTYLSGYSLQHNHWKRNTQPWKIISEKYYDSGKVRFVGNPAPIVDKKRNWPIPSAVISAHFIFTYGTWLDEVPYDPIIYFDGEEDTLSARSWTHGWDIFYPHHTYIWHLYGRTDQKKHWDVHPEWGEIKRISEARVRQILGQEPTDEDFGVYGLGTQRSFEDYQTFSGLYFPVWHLGRRAKTGDVSIEETDPPSENAKHNKAVVCTYKLENGFYAMTGDGGWQEQIDGHLYQFKQVAENNGQRFLYDSTRQLYIKLTDQHASWGVGDSFNNIEHWNIAHIVVDNNC